MRGALARRLLVLLPFLMLVTHGSYIALALEPDEYDFPAALEGWRDETNGVRTIGDAVEKHPMIGTDVATYLALARRPVSRGFLESRSPHGTRRVNSAIVFAITKTVPVSATAGFLITSLMMGTLAIAGLCRLYARMGVPRALQALGAAAFVAVPIFGVALSAPVFIDIGQWCLMIWAAERWMARAVGASLAVLTIGVLWHEASLALVVVLLIDALRRHAGRRTLALFVIPPLVAGLLRVVVPPSASFDWFDLIGHALDVRVWQFGTPAWFVQVTVLIVSGAGVLGLAGVAGLTRFARSPGGYLLWMAPLSFALTLVLDSRSLVPLAALVLIPACLLWLETRPRWVHIAAASCLGVGWIATTTAWEMKTFVGPSLAAHWVLAAAIVGLGTYAAANPRADGPMAPAG